MIKSTVFTTDNPALQESYKYLTEEAKAEIHRLEQVEAILKESLLPLEKGEVRPLSYFASLYMEYNSINQSEVDGKLAINISLLHFQLAKLEAMVIV